MSCPRLFFIIRQSLFYSGKVLRVYALALLEYESYGFFGLFMIITQDIAKKHLEKVYKKTMVNNFTI